VARGRRPGGGNSREAIAAAARARFAELGYDRTTIRGVAGSAGVDPALVMHFYGSKQRLFIETMQLPFDAPALAEELAAGDRATVGRRVIEYLLAAWDQPHTRALFVGRARASASEPEAAKLLREQITRELIGPLARRLGADRPELRAALVSTQLIGWVFARWILEVEALKPLDAGEAARVLGPTLQRYLLEPLD
jgi:AcrR family transcriptional regulator